MTDPKISELDQSGLTEHHKLSMADCVIAWARFESQLRALLARLEGRSLDEGARLYGKLSPDDAWKRIKRTLRERGANEDVLRRIQCNRERSRESYHFRRLIVHAGCVGYWKSDPNLLCFAPFESEDEGQMIVEWVATDTIREATTIAERGFQLALRILDTIGD